MNATDTQSDDDYVEGVVCKDSDIQENEMKAFDLSDAGRVLLIRQKGKLSALGYKCTHLGAPLNEGALGDGRLRCQWHGACFNVVTGDIEDFPGLDSLPCYQVTVENDDIKVRAKRTELQTNKRTKPMTKRNSKETQHVVVIGGGPSGAVCVETLRQEGFSGQITLICKENHFPYDRVFVSKVMDIPMNKIQFRTEDFYKDNDIDVLKGVEATSVDPINKKVTLSDGKVVGYDKLYVATGLKARKVNIPGADLDNVVTLRSIDDSRKTQSVLNTNTRVVVLGSSFIAMEAAAYCIQKEVSSVTVVMRDTVPFKPFGDVIGARFKRMLEEKGAKFIPNSGLARCVDNGSGKVTKVELIDGTTMDADLVIMGTGGTCATDFLKGSGIDLRQDGTIDVNEYLQSNNPNVYVGGDIAHAPVWSHNTKAVIGHFGLAHYHGKIAALNMIGKSTKLNNVPYFWVRLFTTTLRYAGHGQYDNILYIGDVDKMKFVAYYLKGDEVVAASSVGMDPVVSQFAETRAQGKKLYRRDVEGDDTFQWAKTLQRS